MDINRISKGQLGTAIARIFGLVDENAVASVAPELMPTTSPWERDEFWALTGGNLCVSGFYITAVAAQYSAMQLRNPAGSGMILIVERIHFFAPAAGFVYVGMNLVSGLTTLANAIDSYHRDSRRAPGGNVIRGLAGRITHGNDAGLIIPQQSVYKAATDSIKETWVLTPGFGLQVASNVVNNDLAPTIFWREKPISDSEQLTF